MPGTTFLRNLAVLFLTGTLLNGCVALADADSLEVLPARMPAPSTAPALLGPIAPVWRTDPDSMPERAAASQRWHEAEVPSAF